MKEITRLDVKRAFAAVLKAIRKGDKGMSQEDLATDSDTDRTYPSLLELGKRCPSLWIVIRYAQALDVAPDLLVKMVMVPLRGENW